MFADRIGWKHVLLVFVVTLALRFQTFYVPVLDVDENFFGLFASTILHGGIPYIDVTDNKPPLIFFLYSLIWLIFGEYNFISLRLITILWITATAFTVGKIGERIADPKTGFAAMLIYGLATTMGEPKMLASNINIFMMLPVSLCFLYFLRAKERDGFSLWAISGALAAASSLLRQQGGIIFAVVLACMLFEIRPFTRFLKRILFGFFGVLLVYAIVFGVLGAMGGMDGFLQTISYGLSYASRGSDFAFWPRFVEKTSLFLFTILPFFILLAYFLFSCARKRHISKNVLYILIWFLLSWWPVCLGRRFYSHYYIQLLPPLALFAAFGWSLICKRTARMAFIAMTVIWAAFFVLIRSETTGLRQKTGIHPSDWVEISKEQCPVGAYVRDHTKFGDRIFIWGVAAPIYVCSERLPASRFIWLDPLTGRLSGGDKYRKQPSDDAGKVAHNPELWQILFSDLEQKAPKYIVDLSRASFGGYRNYPLESYPLLPWMESNGYKLETEINGARIYRIPNSL